MALITSRRLLPLLVTQTLGAVNDNLFKNALVVLILFGAGGAGGPALVALAGGVFILPYVLFSATAGQVADRFEKSRTIVRLKLLEVALMVLAAAGFLWGSQALLFAVLFGLGVQATFFSPLKYGILPDHLAPGELVAGNGLIEAGTFLGILGGTIAGSALYPLAQGAAIVSGCGLVVGLAGAGSAWMVPLAPSRRPGEGVGRNPLTETWALLGDARGNRPVWLCILGLSWFWTIGAVLLAELPTVVRDELGARPQVFTLLLAGFSVGVGAGSAGCSRLLRGEVTARLVPFAAMGLSLFLWDFSHSVRATGLVDVGAVLGRVGGCRMLLDLALVGACGGLYSVPLYAIIQERSAPGRQGSMVAANNVVNAVGMASGAVVTAGLAAWGVGPSSVLVIGAAANFLVALWIVRVIPQETMRAALRWYFRTFHGVRLAGLENLPAAGQPAVFVANHQSFADGCFLGAFLPGSPVFAVDVNVAKQWWARPLLAMVDYFPVDPANPFSTKSMVAEVRKGRALVIFPEGRITVTGALMKVYEGAGMVADKAGAALIPVHIDGLQRSLLSRMAGRGPRRLFPQLSMTVLPAATLELDPGLHGRARRRAVGTVLQGIMEESGFATAAIDQTLFGAVIGAARRLGARRVMVEDPAVRGLSYRALLVGAAVLGRRLAQEAGQGERVGVMLPNAAGAVVAFMGLQAFGRVPAMLNFSAGAEGMLGACRAATLGVVVSSRAFVEKGKLGGVVERMAGSVRFVWLEDLRAGLGVWAKLRGWVEGHVPWVLPGAAGDARGAAAVLFTSGSEGTPKGVVLSHRNLLANVAQVAAVVDFNASDRVFNAMPMFHSFGLTGGTLLPLLHGVRTYFYPSPLHYRIVPQLIYATNSTIAFGTDTFLAGWARFAHPYDFYSVRYVFSGAEKVRDETRRMYAERFGVRVLEGYGATETSPVLALNTAMHSRPGSAGRLLPGVEWRLDRVEGIADGGRLVVRGPNVMAGYLRDTAPGVLEAPEGGWYDTGDVCTVDQEGFVTILARAKRFAKIAGEMVSMPAAEALAAGLWPGAAHAVVAVPDARKGEALVLLTTERGASASALLGHARERGVPEVAVPRVVQVVEALPLLGTGKVDYGAAGKMVEGRAAQGAPLEAVSG